MTVIYLLLLAFAVLLSSFGWSTKIKKVNIPFSWFFIYVFSVIIGFRSKYSGVDTMSYFNYFTDISSNKAPLYAFEIGFTYFTHLIAELTTVEVYIFLLSFLQLFFLYLSCRLLKIKNRLFCIILFVAFMPGLDMLTNGTRGGVSLAVGLLILTITVIKHNKFAILNFFPMLVHASYGILSIISLLVKKFSRQKIHILLFFVNLFLFTTWIFINPLSMLGFIEGFSKDLNYLGKLVRYLLIEKELMSLSVKIYFIIVSVLFTSIYFLTLMVNKKAKNDEILSRMAFIILSGQFIYALFSFSEFSYRFMFLVYPIQILMAVYVIDKYFSGLSRNILVFLLLLAGVLPTYTTKNFSSFDLLNL